MNRPSPLAVRRFAAGLTQAELAELCSLSRPTVVKLENRHHRPQRLTALALASALETTPEELFPPESPSGATGPNDERRPSEAAAAKDRGSSRDHDEI